MQPFYVWYDNFLEELFALEKADMDKFYPELKQQLEKEHVVFHLVEAETVTHAFEVYKETLQKIEIKDTQQVVNKPTFH